jgi:GNAT superfamily N-acetyltransferase
MPHHALPLRETQVEHAGFVLARAFYDDPFMTYAFPNDDHRFRELPWFMSVAVRSALRVGRVDTNARGAGAAVWLPPGTPELDDSLLAANGFRDAPRRLGEETLRRFGGNMDHLGEWHRRLMPERHWYLMILGVDPPYQGRGVGGELMQPILAECDRHGVPAYLETQKARNVPFYRKHGFEVVQETEAPTGGPHWWLMSRTPRKEIRARET